jgi:RNA polymerase sigma-70 factor (ECF subfamily)
MAAGEEAALGTLYDRYGRTLYALAYRILGDRADAEEVVMDALTQAWQTASTYAASRGSVAAWVVMLGRSRALDRLRARDRRVKAMDRASGEDPAGAALSAVEPEAANVAVEHGERRIRVRAALRELPEPQRVCIELAYYQGLTQTEIAARLAEPLGTVKTRMRLALTKLRESLHLSLAELQA